MNGCKEIINTDVGEIRWSSKTVPKHFPEITAEVLEPPKSTQMYNAIPQIYSIPCWSPALIWILEGRLGGDAAW
jgi:hypothetical protein